jgi:hypothetical protein
MGKSAAGCGREGVAVFKTLNFLMIILLGWLAVSVVQAQTVEAEGTAPISGAVGVAKRLALQDAIRQALIQANSQVSTTTVVSSRGVISDNVRFTAKGKVTDVVITDEWTDESNYYVKIRAQVPGASSVMAAPTMHQGPVAAAAVARVSDGPLHYRRKLAISQFHVLDRSQIHDLPDIETELARELKRRLDADGRVLTVDASQYLLPLGEEGMVSQQRIVGALPPAREPGQLAMEFAESMGVQFVVSGVIRDMGVTKHLFGTQVRHLEVELFVYDGISGTQVARHRFSDSVQDSGFGEFPTTAPVMNDKFFASPIGHKVDKALNKMVSTLVGDVDTQPFTARVIRSGGSEVYFDAGGLANVKVGDVLNTYQLAQAPVADLPGQRSLGFSETPTATLVVKQVQRLFSVGELDSDTARLAPGDVIRFEP